MNPGSQGMELSCLSQPTIPTYPNALDDTHCAQCHQDAQFLPDKSVGRSDMHEGQTFQEPPRTWWNVSQMQQASHKQARNKILSHFYWIIY
jgi:hypothetical protein